MFLSKNLLPNALTVVGVLLLINEIQSAQLIKVAEARINSATGQVGIAEQKRGGNPINMIGALGAIYLGVTNRGEDVELTVDSPLPSVEVESTPDIAAPIYQPIPMTKIKAKKSVDLIQQIVNYDRSILMSAVTGCGKTTLLRACLTTIWEQSGKTAAFVVIDPKHSTYGIEKTNPIKEGLPIVSHPSTAEDCTMILLLVEWLLDKFLVGRQKDRQRAEQSNKEYNPAPLYIVFDEWVALQTKMKSRLSKQDYDKFNNMVQELIVMGREDRVRVWLVGQSHQCGQIGLSGSIRDNLGLIGLAAPNDCTSIDAMAADSYLFKNAVDRESIANAAAKLRGTRFYLSTLGVSPVINQTPNITKKLTATDPWENTENAV